MTGALPAGLVPAGLAAGAVWAAGAARSRRAALRSLRRLERDAGTAHRVVLPGAVARRPRPRWWDRVVAPPPALQAVLRDAGVPSALLRAVPRVWPAAIAVVASTAALALLVSGPLLAGLLAAAIGIGSRWAAAWLGRRALHRVEADLPLALDEVVRGLRSGASLLQALGDAAAGPGPLGRDLGDVVFAASHGGGLSGALEGWAERRPLPGVRMTVSALVLGLEAGGAQARVVDAVATTLRERRQVADEVRALASQARLSAVVLSVAPLGFAALLAAADSDVAEFFLDSTVGTLCLAAGLGLDAAAAAWMARIARVAR